MWRGVYFYLLGLCSDWKYVLSQNTLEYLLLVHPAAWWRADPPHHRAGREKERDDHLVLELGPIPGQWTLLEPLISTETNVEMFIKSSFHFILARIRNWVRDKCSEAAPGAVPPGPAAKAGPG